MDRQIVYPAQIPLDSDQLNAQRNAYVALGQLAAMVYGWATVAASGFACAPGTGLAVTIAPGSLLAPGVVDASAYGTLAASGSALVRQYGSRDPVTLTVPGAGATYTVYATPATVDADDTVLPFYNAADPAVTYAGADNSGQAAPTVRQDVAQLGIGTSVPAGAYALWSVTVPAGATSITAAMIAQASGAPFYDTIPDMNANKVNRSGDIMTAALKLQNFYGSSATGSYSYGPGLISQVGTGTTYGTFYTRILNGSYTEALIQVVSPTGTTDFEFRENGDLVTPNGTVAMDAAKVNRAGDTMTGALTVQGFAGSSAIGSYSYGPGLISQVGTGQTYATFYTRILNGSYTEGLIQIVSPTATVNFEFRQTGDLVTPNGTVALEADVAAVQTNLTTEATTRANADAALNAAKVNRAGDTMTGALTVQGFAGSSAAGSYSYGPGLISQVGTGTTYATFYTRILNGSYTEGLIQIVSPTTTVNFEFRQTGDLVTPNGTVALEADVAAVQTNLTTEATTRANADAALNAAKVNRAGDTVTGAITAELQNPSATNGAWNYCPGWLSSAAGRPGSFGLYHQEQVGTQVQGILHLNAPAVGDLYWTFKQNGDLLGPNGTLATQAYAQGASELGTSGYQKFPSGLILQWGTVTITASSSPADNPTTVQFPFAFPTACLSVSGNDTGGACHSVGAAPTSNSTATMASYNFGKTDADDKITVVNYVAWGY